MQLFSIVPKLQYVLSVTVLAPHNASLLTVSMVEASGVIAPFNAASNTLRIEYGPYRLVLPRQTASPVAFFFCIFSERRPV